MAVIGSSAALSFRVWSVSVLVRVRDLFFHGFVAFFEYITGPRKSQIQDAEVLTRGTQ